MRDYRDNPHPAAWILGIGVLGGLGFWFYTSRKKKSQAIAATKSSTVVGVSSMSDVRSEADVERTHIATSLAHNLNISESATRTRTNLEICEEESAQEIAAMEEEIEALRYECGGYRVGTEDADDCYMSLESLEADLYYLCRDGD